MKSVSASLRIPNILRRRRSSHQNSPTLQPWPSSESIVVAQQPITAPPTPTPTEVPIAAESIPPSSNQTHRIRLLAHSDTHGTLNFEPITCDLREGDPPLHIGRFTNRYDPDVANVLVANKLLFKSKVVSRSHAHIWLQSGKFYIKDTKSSSGTFLNHQRLARANEESEPFQLSDEDLLQLGVAYQGGSEDRFKMIKIRIEIDGESLLVANDESNTSTNADHTIPPSVPVEFFRRPSYSNPTHRIRLVPHLDTRPGLNFEPITCNFREDDPPLRIVRLKTKSNIRSDVSLTPKRLAFRSKVVSRYHAEIWLDSGKFYIRDTKSSSGTFLNRERLAPADKESDPFQLNDGDLLQLGVNFQGGLEDHFKAVRMRIEIDRELPLAASDISNTGTNHTVSPQLRDWAKTTLAQYSWKDALRVAPTSGPRRIAVYQVVCDCLETIGHLVDAVDCFHQMMGEFGGETNLHGDHLQWAIDFKQSSFEMLEHLGDTAIVAQEHDNAISYYTSALSLDLPSATSILPKRGNAYVAIGLWQQALDDANKMIELDPSSPWGHDIKNAALQKSRGYDNAINMIEDMLSRMTTSPRDIQCRNDQDISQSGIKAIRKIVEQVTRHLPRVLIDTTTGRLYHRTDHASAFESQPIFNELVSSLTKGIDYARIKREVRQYFQYAMLSHKWEDNEPLFQQVTQTPVYDLDKSPTHDKLQTFCRIVRDAGFRWAWSDTCCINKLDHFVLQEALVAMFRWYQDSAMMIVFLRGVFSSSRRGALVGSVWNTRAWTLQEYVASKIIHFYTEDWTRYLGLELPNHKESPEVISEMEEATGVSAQQLVALRPGLTSIREKLRLASTRETTLVEDAAYSLLGIFSVAGIPAIYGEGESSLGRLLAHVLTGSGDVSILAWNGESGGFNSCLPAHITVFNGPAGSYLPSPIPDIEMEQTIAATHSSFDLDAALNLYDCLSKLPAPWFVASRMKLPCIAFELPSLSRYRSRSGRVYRADTIPFGTVEIKTRHDLSRMKPLYLIHPWLDTLLERQDKSGTIIAREDDLLPPSPDRDDGALSDEEIHEDGAYSGEEMDDDSSSLYESGSSHLTHAAPLDRETRARRLVAHLRRPFGALLLTLASTGGREGDYKRVAADGMITVRLSETVSLADIMENVRTLDVL